MIAPALTQLGGTLLNQYALNQAYKQRGNIANQNRANEQAYQAQRSSMLENQIGDIMKGRSNENIITEKANMAEALKAAINQAIAKPQQGAGIYGEGVQSTHNAIMDRANNYATLRGAQVAANNIQRKTGDVITDYGIDDALRRNYRSGAREIEDMRLGAVRPNADLATLAQLLNTAGQMWAYKNPKTPDNAFDKDAFTSSNSYGFGLR